MVPPKQKTLRVVKHPQGLSVVFQAAGGWGIGIPLKRTTQSYRDGPNVEVTEGVHKTADPRAIASKNSAQTPKPTAP